MILNKNLINSKGICGIFSKALTNKARVERKFKFDIIIW